MFVGNGYDAELWQFSQQLYPDLPPIEAYLALHRDYVAPMAGPVINGALTLAEFWALCSDPTSWVSKIQGVRLGKESAEWLYDYIKSLFATPQQTVSNLAADEKEISAQLTAEIWKRYKAGTLGQPNPFTDGVGTSAASASSGAAESLFDRINYLECWKTALRTIQDCPGTADDQSSECGPDGFARPIYDLIKMQIKKLNAADRKNHRFFIYHDSNNWHPAFERLTTENPLPSEFINNPCDDLDRVCLFMREVRQKLLAEDEKRGKGIIFHLLIPSWSKLQIKEPLHFPEDLYPLQIEGLKHAGENQVKLNLPAAPPGLLHGVSNVLDPNNWNTIAGGAGTAVTLPAVGWGVNGACLAVGLGVGTLTGVGTLLAIPLWMGTAPFAMGMSAPVIHETIYDALCEEDPRVLGSKERLHMPRRRF